MEIKTDKIAEEKWSDISTSMSGDLGITKENFEKLKMLFMKGYMCGQEDAVDSMREVYYNDPCLFEEYFTEDL